MFISCSVGDKHIIAVGVVLLERISSEKKREDGFEGCVSFCKTFLEV